MHEEAKRGRGGWLWGLGYLFLRWVLASLPGYTYDVGAYKRWAIHAAREGLTQVYRTSDFDYPPLYAYLLWPIGKLYGLLSPEALATMGDSTLLTILIKLPPLLFDLLIGAVLHRLGQDLEARGAKGPTIAGRALSWSLLLPALYLLNPAVLWNTAYWGQPDSIHSAFVLIAFLALGASARAGATPPVLGRFQGAMAAWCALTLATLMKPLGAPYFPVLFVLTLAWCGIGGVIRGVAVAAGTTLLLLLPFLLHNPWGEFFHRLLGDVGAMPYTSVNGHNLWWALGGWRNAEEPWLGPITATQFGLFLFALLMGAVLVLGHLRHRSQPAGLSAAQGLLMAFVVGLGFFMLSTHMHENHMFLMVPLFLPLIAFARGDERRMLLFFFAISFGLLLNLALHDLDLPEHAPFTWGGPSGIESVHLKRPFFVTELWSIRFATAWNLALFAAILASVFRREGMFDRLRAE